MSRHTYAIGVLDRYGGKISSEWFFPKPWQILDEAPEVYTAAEWLIEAADWVVWQLTGVETRNECTAGYKAIWSKHEGFLPDAFFKALDPRIEQIVDEKMSRTLLPLGAKAGELTALLDPALVLFSPDGLIEEQLASLLGLGTAHIEAQAGWR